MVGGNAAYEAEFLDAKPFCSAVGAGAPGAPRSHDEMPPNGSTPNAASAVPVTATAASTKTSARTARFECLRGLEAPPLRAETPARVRTSFHEGARSRRSGTCSYSTSLTRSSSSLTSAPLPERAVVQRAVG